MALLTEAELTQKVEQVFAALCPIYAISLPAATGADQLSAQLRAQRADLDEWDDDAMAQFFEQSNCRWAVYWKHNGGGAMSNLYTACDQWRYALELMEPLAQMWQESAAQSQTFAQKGELTPQERLQAYEASAKLRGTIANALDTVRTELVMVEESTQRTAQQLELTAAYLPLHDELVKLLNDHYYSGKVTRILAGRNWLENEEQVSSNLLDPSALTAKLEAILTAFADLSEVTNDLAMRADMLEAEIVAKYHVHDACELNYDECDELDQQISALWQEAGPGVHELAEVVQLMGQAITFAQNIDRVWQHVKDNSQTFSSSGKLSPVELDCAFEVSYDYRISLQAVLESMRSLLSQAATKAEPQVKQLIAAYQPQHEELIKLCAEPRQCAAVAQILALMEI